MGDNYLDHKTVKKGKIKLSELEGLKDM